MTLEKLFGTSPRKESLCTRVSCRAREEEEMYMRVMAELDAEDDTLDAGEIEIDDSELQKALEERAELTCLPTHRNCVMSAVEAPVLLGRICSFWLHIVEPGCPKKTLGMLEGKFKERVKEKLAQRRETARMWLEHLIPALIPFASRWEHVTFATRFSSVLAPLSHLTEADVPLLKSVDIRPPTGEFAEDHITIRWDSLGFLGGPEIRSVSIFGTRAITLDLPLRWGHLTNLSIRDDSISTETSLQVFSRCSHLQTCQLSIYDAPNHPSSRLEEPVIEIPFLHTLDLTCLGNLSSTVRRLFGCLSLPQLRIFKLGATFEQHPRAESTSSMADARLLAVAPRLEILQLTIRKLSSKMALSDFLRRLPPTLCTIEIYPFCIPGFSEVLFEIVPLDDEVLESFILSPNFPTSCLRTLEVQYPCSFSDDLLLRFIKLPALERVVMDFTQDMQHLFPELQPLVQSGPQIEFTHPPPEEYHFSPWEDLPDAPNYVQTH
ncbi:hypothetical protein FB451DRAFT_1450335 [Mycena latifolia]|nr:hypothetical protein FB451DRAFT_1450335 [Mycena latifolia]